MVKNLPAVRSLNWEDPLEKGMATHSSILAWKIPWAEEPGGLQSHGVAESQKLSLSLPSPQEMQNARTGKTWNSIILIN